MWFSSSGNFLKVDVLLCLEVSYVSSCAIMIMNSKVLLVVLQSQRNQLACILVSRLFAYA